MNPSAGGNTGQFFAVHRTSCRKADTNCYLPSPRKAVPPKTCPRRSGGFFAAYRPGDLVCGAAVPRPLPHALAYILLVPRLSVWQSQIEGLFFASLEVVDCRCERLLLRCSGRRSADCKCKQASHYKCPDAHNPLLFEIRPQLR